MAVQFRCSVLVFLIPFILLKSPMLKKCLITLPAGFLILFLTHSLPNGSETLAARQFDEAKACFQNQEFFQAQRLANLARINCPSSAAPWLLIGHCFYLQGQDQAALYYYSAALKLNPAIGHLPPFLASLRDHSQTPAAALSPKDLAVPAPEDRPDDHGQCSRHQTDRPEKGHA